MREAPLWLYRICQQIIKAYLWLFKRYNVVTKENFPADGPVLVCGNHLSNSDCLCICAESPVLVHFIAKRSLFKFKSFGNLIRYFGAFPVKPRFENEKPKSIDPSGDKISAIEYSMKLLKDGKCVGLFPEGHRKKTWENSGYNIRSGAGVLAIETGCKVVPVGIIGGEKLFEKTTMVVGKPQIFEKQTDKIYTHEDYVEISKEILREAYRLADAKPPFEK